MHGLQDLPDVFWCTRKGSRRAPDLLSWCWPGKRPFR